MPEQLSTDPCVQVSAKPNLTPVVVRHPFYGPAVPNENWVPAPRYMLRRSRILHHFDNLPAGNLLEIGCGTGALLDDLSGRGFPCTGIDWSGSARQMANSINAGNDRVTISDTIEKSDSHNYQYVCAFEVLEHIEDDIGALEEWCELLDDDGKLLLSVPAHPEMYNAADEWAGHVRRYSRAQLTDALTQAGFEVLLLESYGYPLANIMERLRARAYGKQLENRQKSDLDRDGKTAESGTDRRIEAKFWNVLQFPLTVFAMKFFCRAQQAFLNTDLGNGYLVIAQKAR